MERDGGAPVNGGLEIRIAPDGAGALVTISGELDLSTAPVLRDVLVRVTRQLPPSGPGVVLDLAGLAFVDSTGLTVLVATARRLRAIGCELWIRSPQPPVSRVLALSGLDEVLPEVLDERGATSAR